MELKPCEIGCESRFTIHVKKAPVNARGFKLEALRKPGMLTEIFSCGDCSFKWALLEGVEKYRLDAGREAVVAALRNSCTLNVMGETVELGVKDLAYVSGPLNLEIKGVGSLIVVGEGPSRNQRVWFVKRFAELRPVASGAEGYRRNVYVAVGERDPSTSLMAGFTEGWPGEWTSFPPHKHDDKVEVYVYYGMGRGFGVQIVEDEEGADAFLVRDYDAVVIARGYHPNVASPGSRICYLWILCQVKGEKTMRVEFKPGFESMPLGSTHLKR